MRRLMVLLVIGLGFSLVVLPMVNGSAEAAPKVLKIGNTVPMKAKEGIQIKKWLELLAERVVSDSKVVLSLARTGEAFDNSSSLQ